MTAATLAPAGRSPWRDARRRFLRNRAAVASLVVLALIALACVFGPMLLPNAFDSVDWNLMSAPPTRAGWHLFGTDDLGRDLLVRTLIGGRISLLVPSARRCGARRREKAELPLRAWRGRRTSTRQIRSAGIGRGRVGGSSLQCARTSMGTSIRDRMVHRRFAHERSEPPSRAVASAWSLLALSPGLFR